MHLLKSSLSFKEGDPHYTQHIVTVPIPNVKQYSGKSCFHWTDVGVQEGHNGVRSQSTMLAGVHGTNVLSILISVWRPLQNTETVKKTKKLLHRP